MLVLLLEEHQKETIGIGSSGVLCPAPPPLRSRPFLVGPLKTDTRYLVKGSHRSTAPGPDLRFWPSRPRRGRYPRCAVQGTWRGGLAYWSKDQRVCQLLICFACLLSCLLTYWSSCPLAYFLPPLLACTYSTCLLSVLLTYLDHNHMSSDSESSDEQENLSHMATINLWDGVV